MSCDPKVPLLLGWVFLIVACGMVGWSMILLGRVRKLLGELEEFRG